MPTPEVHVCLLSGQLLPKRTHDYVSHWEYQGHFPDGMRQPNPNRPAEQAHFGKRLFGGRQNR